jgi:hypothetical protein
MSKMKYLWTTALLALCVCLASGAALAQDWAVDSQDLPSALLWDATYDASVGAENTSGGSWSTTYDLRSVDGATAAASVVDRWGLTYTPEGGISPPVADAAVAAFAFTVTAPPITTMDTLDCNWMMANNAVLMTDDTATSDVSISRFYEVQPGEGGNWARNQIEGIAGRVPSIASGFSPGVYGPTVPVSRDQMAVFIARAAKLALLTPAEATFGDVPTDFWAYSEIETLVDAGIVSGYGGDTYQPGWTVTRAQMAVFVTNATGYDAPDPTADLFLDVAVGYWADNEIGACVTNGVVGGYLDGYYRPAWTLTRDQMAVFMYRAFIAPTGCAVVLGGPATTDIDPGAATYDGWSSQDTDPAYAYVLFDAAALDDNLDGSTDGDWTVTFDFRDAATPTVTGTTVDVDVSTGSIPGTGTYFTVSTAVPGLAAGDYVMVVLVEDETGAMVEIARTVALTIS